MARGSRSKASASDGPPPSHPQEKYKDHRNFLIRSLERNDVDIAALTELNRSLHKAKKSILQSCGELVLIDLGAGRLTLVNDELHEEKTEETEEENTLQHHLTPAQKELCVDFLLRMKLRRKLSNRLARRLNRVAHAMDGEDVAPPMPPRYGDLRLHIDPTALKGHAERWKLEADAKQKIREVKTLLEAEREKEREEKKKMAQEEGNEEEKEEASAVEKGQAEEKDDEEITSSDTAPMDVDSAPSSSLPKPDIESSVPEPSGESSEQTSTEIPPDPVASSNKTENLQAAEKYEPPSLAEEYEVLKEYDTAYEKKWDPVTKKFNYTLADQSIEPGYKAIKQGTGIGAGMRIMSDQEKEIEHKRWQTNLLVRIPEQPTFEELGLKNRVFCVQERRKRCIEADSEESDDGEESAKKKKTEEGEDNVGDEKKAGSDDGSSNMLDEDQDQTENDKKPDTATDHGEGEGSAEEKEDGDIEMKADEEKAETAEVKKETAEVEEDEKKTEDNEDASEEMPKRVRPMSLAAIPSFYDQDMARIRMIHGDLLGTSMLEHARKRLSEVTREYNNSFQISNQLYDHRMRLQQSLTYFMAKSRTELAKVNNDYAIQVAIAKRRWLQQKQENDMERMKSALPSKWGRQPFGTNTTQNYMRTPGIKNVVGQCVADIVDGSLMIAEGKVPSKKVDPFVPPPVPGTNQQTGESLAQQQMRMEANLRKQLTDVHAKFGTSEENRKRTWKKMMKTKVELEIPPQYGRRGRINLSNYHLIPVPPLRNSAQQVMPRELEIARSAVATYTPPQSTGLMHGTSDSKYSAARVRQRVAVDGTVAPVSEPKKTKDGLYQRPAGRTRKGMQWDAIRGIWVPEGSQ